LKDAGARRLSPAFFRRPVLVVARGLLGRRLVFDGPGGRTAGKIVEVEAYRGTHDPASHAFRGPTPRSTIMFGPPGRVYVYLSYGMHACINLVAEPEGGAAAVLLRALAPLEGLALMRARRPGAADHRLLSGPGCLTRGMGIDLMLNGSDLTTGPLWVDAARPRKGGSRVVAGPRIGIRRAAGRPWRFVLEGHPSVSGPRRIPVRVGARVSRLRAPRTSLTARTFAGWREIHILRTVIDFLFLTG
jgi:DNA-3-methyladenine glycosylase